MEIKINRDVLLKGVSRVQGILEKRSHMPILSTVLLITREDKVRNISNRSKRLDFKIVIRLKLSNLVV